MGYVLAIGTMKGAWIARSDDRVSWDLDGPLLKGWEVNTFGQAPDGTWLATTGSSWFGAAVHRSDDFANWTQVVDGPSYEGATGRPQVGADLDARRRRRSALRRRGGGWAVPQRNRR